MHKAQPGILLLSVLLLSGCIASPTFLRPAGKAIPLSQVRFYVKPQWPRQKVVIARLYTGGYLGGMSSIYLDCRILLALRKEAARIGADAVLLEDPPTVEFGSEMPDGDGDGGDGYGGDGDGGGVANGYGTIGPGAPGFGHYLSYPVYRAFAAQTATPDQKHAFDVDRRFCHLP